MSDLHTITQILLRRLTQLNTDKTERLRRRRTLLQNRSYVGNFPAKRHLMGAKSHKNPTLFQAYSKS